MTKLKDKVQDALDESRMMVLGVQVLIGFGYRAPFEKGFDAMPRTAQLLQLTSLTVLLVTFACLLTPGANHRIVEHGQDSPGFHRLATGFASVALFPFAVALGIDMTVACWKLAGAPGAIVAGVIMGVVALAMWYGVELVYGRGGKSAMAAEDSGKTNVHNKIRHALTEARVVLPGAQALLGFQLATMLLEGFDKLPRALKWVHFASLSCIAIAIVLLITPAAWHRIVEGGEENERTHKVASAMVVAALVPLALGLTGDFLIVSYKVTNSPPLAAGLAGAIFVIFFGLWFGLTLARRHASASET